jgi:hypothetical protein
VAKKTYTIPVSWTVVANMEIEAESLEEAIEIAEEEDLPTDNEYLDSSFEVNEGCVRELNDGVNDEKS